MHTLPAELESGFKLHEYSGRKACQSRSGIVMVQIDVPGLQGPISLRLCPTHLRECAQVPGMTLRSLSVGQGPEQGQGSPSRGSVSRDAVGNAGIIEETSEDGIPIRGVDATGKPYGGNLHEDRELAQEVITYLHLPLRV